MTFHFLYDIILNVLREWRNWQTRTFEGRVVLPYGFNSRLPHQQKEDFQPEILFLFLWERLNPLALRTFAPLSTIVSNRTLFALKLGCESGAHTPLEVRRARSSGAECGYIRQRRNSRPFPEILFLFLWERLNSFFQLTPLVSLHAIFYNHISLFSFQHL